MTLALATATPATAFNGLFYATAATVIPVLFLAIAVQGRTYEDLLKAYVDTYRRAAQRAAPHIPGYRQLIGAIPPITGAILIVACLAYEEISALLALYWQHSVDGPVVLIAAVGLTAGVVGVPALAHIRAVLRAARALEVAGPAGPHSAEPPGRGEDSGGGTSNGTGKPDRAPGTAPGKPSPS